MKTQFTEQSERKLLSEFDPALILYNALVSSYGLIGINPYEIEIRLYKN